MAISKERLKESAAVSGLLGAGASYTSGAITNNIQHFIEYRFQQFKDAAYSDLMHPIQNISTALSNDLFLQTQPFIILGSFLLFGKMMLNKDKKYEDASKYGAHGTSRWANKEEIFDPKDINTKLFNEGTILSTYNKKPILLKDESWKNKNIMIIGGSGAGKSASFVIPNILNTLEKSIVVTDPKGELYEKTSEIKRKQGYKVHLVNFKELNISDRYNPFDYIREETDALRVAKAIIMNSGGTDKKMKGDFWDKAETALLSSFMLFVKYTRPEEEHHFGSVFNLATQSYKTIHQTFHKLPKDHIAFRAYQQAIEKLDDKVRANVFISLLVSLDLWKYQKVCDFTAKSDFMLSDVGKEKSIIYVILPIAEEEFRPLISTFFTQLFTELYSLADHHFNKLPVKVKMILDEFNNIGKIPNFEERLSTTRSYGIEVFPIIQSMGQMKARWGQDSTDEIIDNCDTILYLGSNSLSSKEYFSKLLGKTTVKIQSESKSKNTNGSGSSESFSMTSRSLLTPDELGRIGDSESIIFMKGKYPMKVQKAWFNEIKPLNSLMGDQVSRHDYPAANRGEYIAFVPKEEAETETDMKGFMDEFVAAADAAIPQHLEHLDLPEGVVFENWDLPPIDQETGEIIEEELPLIEEKEEEKEETAEIENEPEENPNVEKIPGDPNEQETEQSKDQNPAVKEETFDPLADMMKNFKF